MRPAVLLLVLGLLAACTSYRDPVLKVTGIRMLEQTDEAVQVGFTMQMHNPNEEALELLNFKYELRIDGRTVFSGRRAAQATLGAGTSRFVMLPAVIPYGKARWAPGEIPDDFAYRLGGTLGYVTPGELAETLLDTGLRRPKVRFAANGKITGGQEEGLPTMFQDEPPSPEGPAEPGMEGM